MTPSVVIAGTHSGVGKTLISIGIMAALKKRGFKVQPFKVGPDYIDPGYHTHVTGNCSRNLDGWMMGKAAVLDSFTHNSATCDIAVVEGVMGLYDGRNGLDEAGSTAQIAKWLDIPVILIVDGKGAARSVAATIKGFAEFDRTRLAGVICNKVGSERHKKYIQDAVESNTDVRVLGFLPVDEKLSIGKRHLGLYLSEEGLQKHDFVDNLTTKIEEHIDIGALLEVCTPATSKQNKENTAHKDTLIFKGAKRIGVAQDAAFSFYYEDNLDMLRQAGAELIPFSPLNDKQLPENLDLLYFGGGYPELHAEKIQNNQTMIDAVQRFAKNGGEIYGECGGFVFLCKSLTVEGRHYSMTGLFPFEIEVRKKRCALGYVEIKTRKDTFLLPKGVTVRGHQFRYSTITNPEIECEKMYTIKETSTGAENLEGYSMGNNVLGSYIHLHFGGINKYE